MPDPITNLQMLSIMKGRWVIEGQVKDLKGAPVSNARITIRCTSLGSFPAVTQVADMQGKYRYIAELELGTNPSLGVSVTAEKEGFRPAHEAANFTEVGVTTAIDLLMRPAQEDNSLLTSDQLVAALLPRCQAANSSDLTADAARQNFERATGLLQDPKSSPKAVPLLAAMIKKSPQCVECRTLLGLADIQVGSMAAAQRDFSAAALVKLHPADERRIVDPLIALGIMAEWSGESSHGLGLLMRASKLAPEDSLARQEVGRALLIQKNWQAADEYLLQAEKAGAAPAVRLLRCRAVLEEGDVQEAEQEIRAYMAGREAKDFPLPVRALYVEVLAQASMVSINQAKPMVDEPLPQILKAWPDLEGLQPASDQSQLPAILEKTGAAVETFFRDFQNATSHERVDEEKLDKHGKVKQALKQNFQYLFVTTALPGGMRLEEYRTDHAGRQIHPTGYDDGFMLSAGFASASLLFHPSYQGGSKFRHLGRAKLSGTDCDVVAFAQIPAKARMIEAFNTPQSRLLILHQGVAWIDPNGSRIVRLRTELLQPVPQARLQRESTEITYTLVQFKKVPDPVSLPAQVTVTVHWNGQTFQNQHQYGDFKLFNTAVHETHPTPQATPPPDPTPN